MLAVSRPSHCLNDDIPDLAALISENISTALIYSCRFWAVHFRDFPRSDGRLRAVIQPLLRMLLCEKVLYWLEILSLVKAVRSVEESLLAAAEYLQGYDDDLTDVAEDARNFANEFKVSIAGAATHIYISALPFCPSDSRVAQIYSRRYPNLLSILSGRRGNFDVPATTRDGHDLSVTSVAFFSDGKLVSGSVDGTMHMWDSNTGKAISAPLTGDMSMVCSVAVSPDGKHIASGSEEKTLQIWDSDTGACPLGPIAAHNGVVRSVAFSPDGSRIVTGSNDCTLKVWNVATGDLCLGPLTGHTSLVTSVAFLPDGTFIASGSYDGTIRIWDASTGESRRDPLTGCSVVGCVAFSAGGHYFASGSSNGMIHLWDVTREFTEIATTTIEGPVWSLSFSPNCNQLVSGSRDGALRFWNISSGGFEPFSEVICCDGIVQSRSVVFSPDGLSVASGSNDRSIKIWTVPITSTQHSAVADGISEISPTETISLDRHGHPVLSDASFIDEDGWMYDSRKEGKRRLFWVPKENRGGFWWPRNTAVIHRTVTRIGFSHFVHGENWAECLSEDI